MVKGAVMYKTVLANSVMNAMKRHGDNIDTYANRECLKALDILENQYGSKLKLNLHPARLTFSENGYICFIHEKNSNDVVLKRLLFTRLKLDELKSILKPRRSLINMEIEFTYEFPENLEWICTYDLNKLLNNLRKRIVNIQSEPSAPKLLDNHTICEIPISCKMYINTEYTLL